MSIIQVIKVGLIAMQLLICSLLFGQNQPDSISLVLKLEHEKAQVLHRKMSYGFTSGKLIVKTKEKTITNTFDTIQTTLQNRCMGDISYALCAQLYRTYDIDSIISIEYLSFKQTNLLSITLNNMIYEIGNVNFENGEEKNLIKGLTFTYKFVGNKKVITFNVNKKLKLKLNESGYAYSKLREKEGPKSNIIKKIEKPIELLPGSHFTIQIIEK